mgnify:CR=1 FL=1
MAISARFKSSVDPSVSKDRKITFFTRFLDDSGEEKLEYIIRTILTFHNQIDLTELIYTACKEFVMNSTKAAIKRIVYDEMKMDAEGIAPTPEAFMKSFKASILSQKFSYFREKMKERRIQTKISFEPNHERLIVRVSNNFALLPKEEERIREKFELATDSGRVSLRSANIKDFDLRVESPSSLIKYATESGKMNLSKKVTIGMFPILERIVKMEIEVIGKSVTGEIELR